jgi:hypothetical protein
MDLFFDAGLPNLTQHHVAARSYIIPSFRQQLLALQLGNSYVEILILGGWSRNCYCRMTSGGLYEVSWGGGIGLQSEEWGFGTSPRMMGGPWDSSCHPLTL